MSASHASHGTGGTAAGILPYCLPPSACLPAALLAPHAAADFTVLCLPPVPCLHRMLRLIFTLLSSALAGPRLPEPAMLNVRLSDLVCGPDLQAILSFNFCSTCVGFAWQRVSVLFYALSGYASEGAQQGVPLPPSGCPPAFPGPCVCLKVAATSSANVWLLPASLLHAFSHASAVGLPPFLPPCTAGSPASWMPAPLRALRTTCYSQTNTRT